jgi:hypothetical protein
MFAHFKNKLNVSHIWTQTQLMLGVNTVHKKQYDKIQRQMRIIENIPAPNGFTVNKSRFSFHSESNI